MIASQRPKGLDICRLRRFFQRQQKTELTGDVRIEIKKRYRLLSGLVGNYLRHLQYPVRNSKAPRDTLFRWSGVSIGYERWLRAPSNDQRGNPVNSPTGQLPLPSPSSFEPHSAIPLVVFPSLLQSIFQLIRSRHAQERHVPRERLSWKH
jgi:hypothetical protein